MAAENPKRDEPRGAIVAVVRSFLTGPASILLIMLAGVLGLLAIVATPREEEPQIVVPMADVYVDFPGHSPREVEELVTVKLERLLWQIDGVEHVYSISNRDQSMVTVRFYVGEDRERAMVKLRDKIDAHLHIVPPGVKGWRVVPVEIDDVPIVTLSIFSESRNGDDLRRIAAEMEARLASTPNVFRTQISGGYEREITVEGDLERMAARGVCLMDMVSALEQSNQLGSAGNVVQDGENLRLVAGHHLQSADEVARTVVREIDDRIVRVEDVATVKDNARDPEWYHHIGFGPATERFSSLRGRALPAVTLAFSKKRGTNAVTVARAIIASANALRGTVLPDDVELVVTRNYGRNANDKVNDLLASMLFAIVTVVGLMALTMGWREAVVVGLAVPVSFALALFVNYAAGFTINRVTLFALILSLGLVVDDPITNVDNIQRHMRMRLRDPFNATLAAVYEVIPPVIMSTLAIVVSFAPMFFITGMMGPYMGPMAINVPMTVFFSTLCALTFVPWVSYHLLKSLAEKRNDTTVEKESSGDDGTSPLIRRLYHAMLSPFLVRRNAVLMLLGIVVLLGVCGGLVYFRYVPLKMLPFDNKDELQLVLEMPEGTPLEKTDRVARELGAYLSTVNEVTNYETYTGLAAPIDFNGLVRHYYLRNQSHQADLRVNLISKYKRSQMSHAIGLRLRDDLTAIARAHGAVLKLVEVPPGPPVLATVTAEVYGTPDSSYKDIIAGAQALEDRLAAEDSRHIVEIDTMAEAEHGQIAFTPDLDKTARHGFAAMEARSALYASVAGYVPGIAHIPNERHPVLIRVRLPEGDRNRLERLQELALRSRKDAAALVPLGELGSFRREAAEQPVYRKDLERVVFVTAELAGRAPGAVVIDMMQHLDRNPLPKGIRASWDGEGEWQITLRVFRDLGLAFGAAMIGIYLLLVLQMRSFFMPMIVMSAIPLTAIGIMPGFFLLNAIGTTPVAGYPNPIFFTATAMIGMIALGGIVIRNSVVLIEFIQDNLREGKELRAALLDSGAVRFRPIVLTALTTMIGAWPITLDPVFSGLAWALIFGLFASTLFSLVVVPTLYSLVGPTVAPDSGEQ